MYTHIRISTLVRSNACHSTLFTISSRQLHSSYGNTSLTSRFTTVSKRGICKNRVPVRLLKQKSWSKFIPACGSRQCFGIAKQRNLRQPHTQSKPTSCAAAASSEPLEGDDAAPRSTWQLLVFTVPTLAIWVVSPLMSLVDTAVVGTRSTLELAALGPGTMLCDQSHYLFTFLATAACNLVAVALARKERPAAQRVLSDAVVLGAAWGAVVATALFCAAPAALRAIAGPASAEIIAPALLYVRIRCWGLIFSFTTFMTHAFFLAAQDPLTPLAAAAAAGLLNLAGDLALVRLCGWGIAGAAVATVAAQALTAAWCLAALSRPLPPHSSEAGWAPGVTWKLPTRPALARFLFHAAPIGGVLFAKVVTNGAITSCASGLSPLSCAAHHIAFSLLLFCSTIGDAVSQAAQTFLPRAVGRPDSAWQLAWSIGRVALLVGLTTACGAAAVAAGAPGTFTASAGVAAGVRGVAPLLFAALLIYTASSASEGLLLAGRDLGFLVRSYIGNMAGVLVALAAIRSAGGGLQSIWWCVLQFQVVRLASNCWRLSSRSSPLNATAQLPAGA